VSSSKPASPALEDHFRPATRLQLLLRREPYDFVETHRLGEELFGHRGAHVNLGLWEPTSSDPGLALVERVADAAQIPRGGTLLDLGSGLGEAAASLCVSRGLQRVVGLNRNTRQVAYANALASMRDLDEKVLHLEGDAAALLDQLANGSWGAAIAVESLGVLSHPKGLLLGLRKALAPGASLAACLNLRKGPTDFKSSALMNLTFGFVPESRDTWSQRLDSAGFTDITFEDITADVLSPACAHGLTELDRIEERNAADVPKWILRHTRRLLTVTHNAVEEDRLSYSLVHAQNPA